VTDGASTPESASTTTAATITVHGKLTGATVTITPSKSIDIGQSVTLTVTWPSGDGTPDYSVSLYTNTLAGCSGTSTLVTTNTGVTGSSTTFSVSPTSTTYYCATVTDSASTPESASTAAAATITVSEATPALTALATTPVALGATSATDTATLTGAFNPTGTVTFTLYTTDPPGTCSGLVGTVTSSTWTSNGGGSYSATGTLEHTFSTAGTYYWVAYFGGDTDNAAAGPTSCGATGETLIVGPSQSTPSISTSAMTPLSIGSTSATDTATLTGAFSPTGTVTFTLYTTDTPGTCTGVVGTTTSSTWTSNGGGSYSATGTVTHTFSTLGSYYYWVASFAGDTNNAAAGPTSCGAPGETLTVGKTTPSISTSAATPLAPGATSATDTATLTGAYTPTGTVTFTLYTTDTSGTCSGVVGTVTSSTWTSNGGGSYTASGTLTYTFSTSGTYYWVASFAGDTYNAAVTGYCGYPGETLSVVTTVPEFPAGILVLVVPVLVVYLFTRYGIRGRGKRPMAGPAR
jgi:hypothetical protein